ncbi:MAG: hypothetical protein KatS3mg058_3445 [Roseiflexus sp.]|nr:MAG: hypothetical protein KatS3mg058_3445 [Roseiflexus sp.]
MTIRQNAADTGSILARLRFAIRCFSIYRREGSLRHLLLCGALPHSVRSYRAVIAVGWRSSAAMSRSIFSGVSVGA